MKLLSRIEVHWVIIKMGINWYFDLKLKLWYSKKAALLRNFVRSRTAVITIGMAPVLSEGSPTVRIETDSGNGNILSDSALFSGADTENELVDASLTAALDNDFNDEQWSSLLTDLQETSIDDDQPQQFRATIPKYFPSDFFKPFSAVPSPDPDGATAKFEAIATDRSERAIGQDIQIDPLVTETREQIRKLYPDASEQGVDERVEQFMGHLRMPGAPSTGELSVDDTAPGVQDLYMGEGSTEPLRVLQESSRQELEDAQRDFFEEFANLLRPHNDNELGGIDADLDLDVSAEPVGVTLADLVPSWTPTFSPPEAPIEETPVETTASRELDEVLRDVYSDELEETDYIRLDAAHIPYKFDLDGESNATLGDAEKLLKAGDVYKAMDALEWILQSKQLGTEDCMHAWYLLGVTHAENGDDVRAIQALSNVDRMMTESEAHMHQLDTSRESFARIAARAALLLAAAYTNELDTDRARAHLRRWLALNKAERKEDEEVDDEDDDELDVVVGGADSRLSRRLARAVAQDANDGDAVLALVTLRAVEGESGAAAELLRDVCISRRTDALLWIRLGSLLEAAGLQEDASCALRRAADLRPKVARSWLRLGTVRLVERPDLAVRYVLKGLDMAREERRALKHREPWRSAWSHLVAVLNALGRPELVDHALARDLDAFRTHFTF